MIVVASLIDKTPNLGGLARTCEVFGVSEYVLGSLKYIEDKQFQSLSVTAEKWISITEVKFCKNNFSFLLIRYRLIFCDFLGKTILLKGIFSENEAKWICSFRS